jgi:hypothetical protein
MNIECFGAETFPETVALLSIHIVGRLWVSRWARDSEKSQRKQALPIVTFSNLP